MVSHTTLFCTFCLQGLERMYCPKTQLFSSSYRLAGGGMKNLYEPGAQAKYTLNCLMGLHRAEKAGYALFCEVPRAYASVVESAEEHMGDAENMAAALWAADAIGVEPLSGHVDWVQSFVESASRPALTAQALAWLILASAGSTSATRRQLPALIDLALQRYVHPRTFLVRHVPDGLRSSMASFAASCYTAYALLSVAARNGDRRAHRVGLEIARRLVRLQGPRGQWAWFYHVPRGMVLDYYPVYAVHQHSMAPLFLLAGLDAGERDFREPLKKGFAWILGSNEVGQGMVDKERGVIWRSVERSGAFGRVARGLSAVWPARGPARTAARPRNLRLNTECRSYELGWGLWAFAGREDFDEILDDPSFSRPSVAQGNVNAHLG
jgi:hypothetical protein